MKRVIGSRGTVRRGLPSALLGLCVLACAPAIAGPPAGVFVDARPVQGQGLQTPWADLAWGLSADGLTLYFCSSRFSNEWTNWDRFDMYEATRESGDEPFQDLRKLDELNSRAADVDPWISHDGLSFYFASNRGGNWDIWVARRDTIEEDFVKARVENLGPPVNTSGAEGSPSVCCDEKMLVFVRDGDLYSATREKAKDVDGNPVPFGEAVSLGDQGDVESGAISCDGRAIFFTDFVSGIPGPSPRPGGLGLADIWMSWREAITDPFPEPVNLGPPVCSPYSDMAVFVSHDWPIHESVLYFTATRPHPLARGPFDMFQATWLATAPEKISYEMEPPRTSGALNCGGREVDATAEIGAKFERDRFFGDDISWSGDPETGIKVIRAALGHVPFEKPEDGWVLGRDNPCTVRVTRIPGARSRTAELFSTSAFSSRETVPSDLGIPPPERLHYRALVLPGRYEVTLYFAEGSPDAVSGTGGGARAIDVSLNGEKVLGNWSAASAAGSPAASGNPQVLCGAALNVAIARKFSLDVPDDDPADGVGTLDIVLEPAEEIPGDPELNAFRFERVGDVSGEPVSGDIERVALDPESHLEQEAYQRALERWIEGGTLWINCGGPLLACAREGGIWIGDQATSQDLEPVTNDFFRLTPLDEGLTPGLKIASTNLGAFDARGTEEGLDQDDAVFYTQRQGAFRYDMFAEDGFYELTLYFGNALRETAGSGKCFFRIEVEERRLSFEEVWTHPCEFIGKDELGELVPHPAFGWGGLYDPFDHAECTYSTDPCNFAECPENGIVADDDPDGDGVPASLECGSGAAVALWFGVVEVTGGSLSVVVGYPVLAEGEPRSDGTPFLSGLGVRRLPGVHFHRGDVDQNGELELSDAIQQIAYLFFGCLGCTRAPECEDAADADDNGVIELTDSIRILGYLFLGTGTIPFPGAPPDPCGPDPTTDDLLGCESYDSQHCR